jgi:prepilin-type N-terminal cleavage/methylation domain-containing protein
MTTDRIYTPRRSAGFTLLELVVTVAILGLVLTSLGLVQSRSSKESMVLRARAVAESRVRRTLDAVAAELTAVGRSLLLPDPTTVFGASTVTFQHPMGVSNAGLVLWGTASRLSLELDPRELNNGVDDDGDGLIDEQQLVFTRDFGTANARRVVLCTNIPELAPGEIAGNGIDDNGNGVVDEAGFNIRRIGDLLSVHLTVLQPYGGNRVASTTLETSIVLHN